MSSENQFNTKWCWIGIRERERSDMPGRGIDLVGVEEGSLYTVVLCEVKVSEEDGRIPQVVDSSEDSLSKQLCKHMTERTSTSRRLWESVRRTRDTNSLALITKVAVLWQREEWQRLRIFCCGVLVRPTEKYNIRDFGTLRQNPEILDPAFLRFLIICLNGEINLLVNRFNNEN